MATLAQRTPDDAPGDLFVDRSCIACDTCRRTAPGVFGGGEDDPAFVARQPVSRHDDLRARMALVACPVSAIGTIARRARVLHQDDVTSATSRMEHPIRGRDPVPLAPDLRAAPVPGHTAGSAALLARDVLFTGDHLWGDAAGQLDAGRGVCWFGWGEQVRSMERLLALRFTTVLPGHGRPWRGRSPETTRAALRALLARMRAQG